MTDFDSNGNRQTWRSVTKKFQVGPECGYLTVVLEDEKPIRILVDISRQGSTVSGFARQWAQMFTLALDAGAPLEKLVEENLGVSFEPDSWSDMGFARSIVDYIAKYIHERYLMSKG